VSPRSQNFKWRLLRIQRCNHNRQLIQQTPCIRVLLEKLIVAQLVNIPPAFHELQVSLLFIRTPVSFPKKTSDFQNNILYAHLSNACCMLRPSHTPSFNNSNSIRRRVQVTKLLNVQFFSTLPPFPSSLVHVFSSAPCSQRPPICVLPLV
jgi:hypothetical protein